MDLRYSLTVLFSLLLAGCGASYSAPGRGAKLAAFGVSEAEAQSSTDATVKTTYDKKPLASFPTGVAVVRVQAPGYTSPTAQGWGSGRYSIVLTRDVETDDSIARLEHLPMVHGIAPINRLLLPQQLNSDLELRQAAAALHADMLLIYTFDTTFTSKDTAEPLTIISLGLAPTEKMRVVTTASALLMDTRNGFIYGVAEATQRDEGRSMAWTSEHAVDESRRKTEQQAFNKLVSELERTWGGVVRTYAGGYSTEPKTAQGQ